MKEVRVTGHYTFDDYLTSNQAHSRTRRLVLKAVLAVAGVVMMIQESWTERILGAVILTYAFILSGVVFSWLIKRQWDGYPALRKKKVDLRFSAEGLHGTDDEGKPQLLTWDTFTRWTDAPQTVMLYRSPQFWIMVPKRLLNDKQNARLREMLVEHVG